MKKPKSLFVLLVVCGLSVSVSGVTAPPITMETPLPVGLRDVSDLVEVYQPFLDDLELITKLKVTFGGTGADVFNRVAAGDLIFGTSLTIQSGIPAMALYWSMPFGMEGPEFIAWLYEGGGLTLARQFYANEGNEGVVPIPFRVTVACPKLEN